MRIEQIKVSQSINSQKFVQEFGLLEYKDIYKPTLFIGCFVPDDYETIINHKGLGVLRWCGSDTIQDRILLYGNFFNALKQKRNIKHIAISDYIASDLDRYGVSYIKYPCTPARKIMEPVPLGDCVYSYVPSGRYDFYGGKILDEVMKRTKYEFIIASSLKHFTPEELKEAYRRSFIGLRLTAHDGLPTTVVELALMGRRSVFNGRIPCTIGWRDADKVIRIIEKEKERNPGVEIVAKNMLEYIDTEYFWMDTDFWIGK